MNNFKMLVLGQLAVLFLVSPVFALNASDLNAVTNGSVGFNSATKTTTITTNVGTSVTDVNWNRFNIGAGETLTNSFSSAGQTIINRVIGLDLSTIAGTINSAGLGAATGKVVLINPNGVLFNGATINVAGFLASTLNTSSVLPNEIDLMGGKNKDILIYNSTINTPQGAAFVTNGNIDVRNSSITTKDIANSTYGTGNIQLVTADGVNFKFVTGGAKARWVCDTEHYGTTADDSVVTANNKTSASQIQVSNSLIDSGKAHVLLSTNSEYAADSNIIVYANTAIKAPNGTITLLALNTSYRNDPRYKDNLLDSTKPAPDYYSSVKVYSDINSANEVDLSGTNSTIAKNIKATSSIVLGGNSIKATSVSSPSLLVSGDYDIASGVKSNWLAQWMANQIIFGNKVSIKDTQPANPPDVSIDWRVPVPTATTVTTSSKDPSQFLPKINNSQTLAMKTPSSLAGAAAKVRRRQNSKFIGHFDKENPSKIKYFEVLK